MGEVKKLNLSERQLLEVIIHYSYDGSFITDGNGIILLVNDSYTRITGHQARDLVGKHISCLRKQGILHTTLIDKVMEARQPLTMLLDYKNGQDVMVTGIPIFDTEGNIVAVVGNLRDLTELIRLKAKLTRSEQLTEQKRHQIEELKLQQIENIETVERSKDMLDLVHLAGRIAKVDSTVLITGESGVGKDVYARMIHKLANYNPSRPFMKISCGAIPETLLESELFGYEQGAFTGAKKEGKPGIFELVEDGTVFLDEIGELPLSLQVKLLTVLQDRQFVRLGGTKTIKMQARVIAATNRDLTQEAKKGGFRSDLYYRLNVIPIKIPPLRERKEDILPLITLLVKQFNEKHKTNKALENQAIQALEAYDWPGNVRELSNVIERILVLSTGEIASHADLPTEIAAGQGINLSKLADSNLPLKDLLEQVEAQIIAQALTKKATLKQVAEDLGLDLSTLTRKIQKYSLPKRYQTKHIHNDLDYCLIPKPKL